MKTQAVRRSPRWLAIRAWWRQLDLATQLDAIGAGAVFVIYTGLAIFAPELFR